MSVVNNHVHRLDSRVDRIQASLAEFLDTSIDSLSASTISTSVVSKLGALARSFSADSISSSQDLKPAKLLDLLHTFQLLRGDLSHAQSTAEESSVSALSWVVATKAMVQTFAIVTNTLLRQTIPLSDGIYYWDEVLASDFYTGLYTLQSSPLRIAQYVERVYRRAYDACGPQNGSMVVEGLRLRDTQLSLADRWNAFYDVVRESVRRESLARTKMAVLSPFGRSRSEARRKRKKLRRLRELTACGVGLLMEESLLFEIEEDDSSRAKVNLGEWQNIILRSTLLIQTVVKTITSDVDTTSLSEFENNVFAQVSNPAEAVSNSLHAASEDPIEQPHWVIQQLVDTLQQHLPAQQRLFRVSVQQNGKPSRLLRYWLPATVLLFSSSTILNMFTKRRAQLTTWIRELAPTARDFWSNWVIDPLTNLIGIIRHDKNSEVALVAQQSLESDLAMLEDLVVDFVVDYTVPEVRGGKYSPEDIEMIRSGVREGDLTPVVKSYARAVRRPLASAVRGDLVRGLMIQVQKAKVDAGLTVSGIDSMLKSQELLFGFFTLTPGLLVSYATYRWVAGFFGNKRGLRQGQRRDEMRWALCAVDDAITDATPTPRGTLSYKDRGLLVCEVEVLRQRAEQTLPGVVYHRLLDELGKLLGARFKKEAQARVQKLWRVYWKWVQ